jgi:hypothetical protein
MFNLSKFAFSRQNLRQFFPKLGVRTKTLFVLLLCLVGLWSISLGMGMALALDNSKLTDAVPQRLQTGQDLYLETCAGCHIPIPPAVLPIETWQTILEKPNNHYGTKVPLVRITQVLIWDYLRTFSRPLNREEVEPVYVGTSRYFKALHPRVTLPKPVTHKTCIVCHPGAEQFDYRTLSPEWENSP